MKIERKLANKKMQEGKTRNVILVIHFAVINLYQNLQKPLDVGEIEALLRAAPDAALSQHAL